MGFYGKMKSLWFGDSQISPVASSSSSEKYALDSSVTRLLDFEERRGNLEAAIMDLEKAAEDICSTLTNHTTFLIGFNGGGFILQHIPSKLCAYIVTPALIIPFLLTLSYLIYNTKMKLSRLIPTKFSLIIKKRKLTKEVYGLLELESQRLKGDLEDDYTAVLHPLVKVKSVVRRCTSIVNSRDVPPIEESHHWLIMHAIFSAVLHVVFLFFILFLTFSDLPNELIGWIWPAPMLNLVAAT